MAYFGHIVGHRTRGQMCYSGDISNVTLYEITKEDFLIGKKECLLMIIESFIRKSK